jgi:hypothetical protein
MSALTIATIREHSGLFQAIPAGDGVPAFHLLQTPVTNAQYRVAVLAGVVPPPAASNQVWQLRTHDDHPVVDVTLAQAQAYAQWLGGRLPRAVEYARATGAQRYPWGDAAPEPRHASLAQPALQPVGSCPDGAGPYGTLDLVGGVWEWVLPEQPGQVTVTGGAYCTTPAQLAAAGSVSVRTRYYWLTPGMIGFRVAVGPQPPARVALVPARRGRGRPRKDALPRAA